MSKSRVSIAFDQESLRRFGGMVGGGTMAVGAHCGDDDDGEGEGYPLGAVATGAHCGDDDDGEGDGVYTRGAIALGAHCGDDDDGDDGISMAAKLGCLSV